MRYAPRRLNLKKNSVYELSSSEFKALGIKMRHFYMNVANRLCRKVEKTIKTIESLDCHDGCWYPSRIATPNSVVLPQSDR